MTHYLLYEPHAYLTQTMEPISDLRKFMYHNAISRLIKLDVIVKEIGKYVWYGMICYSIVWYGISST